MRLAVLGDPVAHSLSPAIHNAALDAAGISGIYVARAVDSDGLRAVFDDLRSGRLDGASVTMPHKQLAARLCDQLEPSAARAGVVNTLVRVGTAVVGHNTDIAGVRAAWRSEGLPNTGPVVVMGNGGAAAAAVLALQDRELAVQSRSENRALKMCEALGVDAEVQSFGIAAEGATVVNATPLGMRGEAWPAPLLSSAGAIFDMAYGERQTPAVLDARDRGLPVVDGPTMLIAQAIESFRLWTGRVADQVVMKAAAFEMRHDSGGSS